METLETSNAGDAKKDRQPLYPERPSEGIESKIEMLADFEAGRIEKIPITPEERMEIQRLEDTLGATLEKIFEITPKEAVFYAEYFQSPEGRKDFEVLIGKSLGNDGKAVQDIEKSLLEAGPLVAQLGAKERGSFVGRSRDYSEQLLFEQLLQTRDVNGYVEAAGIASPVPVRMLLTPSENLAKITALKKFKDQIKHYTETPDTSMMGKSEGFRQVLSGVLGLYQSRVNAMLVESSVDSFALKRKESVLGEDALTEDEQVLLSQTVGTQNIETNLSRYDKFLFGAASEYDAAGQRNQRRL
jgi:hypothetical protein